MMDFTDIQASMSSTQSAESANATPSDAARVQHAASPRSNFIFVDESVPDYRQLVAALSHDPSANMEIWPVKKGEC